MNLDSRVDGPARPGDLICIKTAVTSIAFPGSYPLYQRFWVSANGAQNGHEVPNPAISFTGGGFYPICYQRSSPIQMQYSTVGTGQSNGVTVQRQVLTTLLDGDGHDLDVYRRLAYVLARTILHYHNSRVTGLHLQAHSTTSILPLGCVCLSTACSRSPSASCDKYV